MRLSEIIKQAIEIGTPNGRITFDQLDDLFKGQKAEPEEIEQLMLALRDADINVTEAYNPSPQQLLQTAMRTQT